MSNLDTGLYECNSRHQFWPRDYSPSRRSRSSRSSSQPSRVSRRKVGESTKSIESIVDRAKSIVYTRLDRLRGIAIIRQIATLFISHNHITPRWFTPHHLTPYHNILQRIKLTYFCI